MSVISSDDNNDDNQCKHNAPFRAPRLLSYEEWFDRTTHAKYTLLEFSTRVTQALSNPTRRKRARKDAEQKSAESKTVQPDHANIVYGILRQLLLYGICAYRKEGDRPFFGMLRPIERSDVSTKEFRVDVTEVGNTPGTRTVTPNVSVRAIWIDPRIGDLKPLWKTPLYAAYEYAREGLIRISGQFAFEQLRANNLPIPFLRSNDPRLGSVPFSSAILADYSNTNPLEPPDADGLVASVPMTEMLVGGLLGTPREPESIPVHVVDVGNSEVTELYRRVHSVSFARAMNLFTKANDPRIPPLTPEMEMRLIELVRQIMEELSILEVSARPTPQPSGDAPAGAEEKRK